MRQKLWLKLVKDYECEIKYDPSKANVVTNTLSKKAYLSQITIHRKLQQELVKEQIKVITWQLASLQIQSTLLDKIYIVQVLDEWCVQIRQRVAKDIEVDLNNIKGIMSFKG